MSNIIQQLEAEQMTKEIPAFYPGDNVVVQVRVKEGERERLQAAIDQAYDAGLIGKNACGSGFEPGSMHRK